MSDEIMVEPYEEVVGNPHYTSISRSPNPVVEEDRSLAETSDSFPCRSDRPTILTVIDCPPLPSTKAPVPSTVAISLHFHISHFILHFSFKGPIVKSSRGVEITTQTGTVASAPWPALGGSCSLAGQLQEPRYQVVKADVATLA